MVASCDSCASKVKVVLLVDHITNFSMSLRVPFKLRFYIQLKK